MSNRSRAASTRFHYAMLLLAASASVAAAIYSASTTTTLRQSVELVTHTLKVQASIDELMAGNMTVETQALRYMISQRPDFLEDYEQARIEVELQLQTLTELTGDNPEQVALGEQLKDAIALRNDWFAGSIEVAQAGPIQAVSARVREGTGALALQRIREIALQMARSEAALLNKRQAVLDQTIVQTTTTSLIVNLLALIVGGIALFSLRQGSRALAAQRVAELEASRAAAASSEKSAFLASISHEIRTPMNAVFGFTQLLAKTRIEPQAREYIKAIQTSGRALLALINDILDLSKIEAGKLPLTLQPTDIRELIDSTLGVFSESANQKRLRLRVQVAADVPRTLCVDPHRLRQVLMNVIANAIKYTDEGQVTVTVSATPAGTESGDRQRTHLRIEVRDTGIGIPIDRQAKLFEPFYRAVGDGDAREGTGLGLAIVARLLRLMNGEITVQSAPGSGSTFSLSVREIEVVSGNAHPLDEAEVDLPFARLVPSRILIVDDVAWNRDLLAAFLAEAEHTFVFASDGEEAVKTALRERPQLILMDLRMPKLDGRSAAQKIRAALGDDAPVMIAVSASSMSCEELDVGSEFEAYIRKPVAREVLFETLVEHLGLAEPDARDSASQAMDSARNRNAVDPEAHAAATSRLQALVDADLDGIMARMRVTEIRKLADTLAELGTQGGMLPIANFAERLRAAVERFDVMQMESLLLQIRDLVTAETQPGRGIS